MKQILLILLACCFLAACGGENGNNNSPQSNSGTPKAGENDATPKENRSPGTLKMAKTLEAILLRSDPTTSEYFSRIRASYFFGEMQKAQGPSRGQYHYAYAQELLNSGQTENAIQEFKTIIKLMGGDYKTIKPNEKIVYENLAISYMRKGEQENCIHNHTPESCIVPLESPGFHKDQTGSREALKIYSLILSQYPDDHQSRWLANIAYMTLGMYPDSVPPQILMPEKVMSSGAGFPKFKDIAMNLGLAVNRLSGGCSAEDFDRDGDLDLFVTSYGPADQAQLFMNQGDGSYKEVTEEAGIKGINGGLNTIHGDYNNDGFPDIYILRGGWLGQGGLYPNSLLKNNGDGTFEDVTFAAGLATRHPSQTGAWADYNGDGFLDLFVGNESVAGQPSHPCEFFHNNGDGTFTDIAAKMGMNTLGYIKGVIWGDVNNDGLPDLYISSMGYENQLFLNRGPLEASGPDAPTWQFEEIGEKAGVQEPQFSFPAWFFDYNNDGFEDIFVNGYDLLRMRDVAMDVAADALGQAFKAELPRLYRNNGPNAKGIPTFTDVTKKAGLSHPLFTMGSNFGDLDNDGFPDMYLGTGAPDYRSIVPNKMFKNYRGLKFVDVTASGGFGHIQKGHGVCFADLDQDGDQDVYAVMGGAYEGDNFQNILYENPGSENTWIVLELEGKSSNRSAIGARIEISIQEKSGKTRTIRTTVSTGGSFGSNSLQQEIGLGQATEILSLKVRWPDGKNTAQTFTGTEIGKKYRLQEGNPEAKPVDYRPLPFKKGDGHHHHQM